MWQSQSAIDIGFGDAADLRRLCPRLLQHALSSFGSPDVLRFIGREQSLTGRGLHGNFADEVVTALRPRAEGVRIKHRVEGNSIKLYEKAFTPLGSVLRAETTINHVEDFQVYRTKQGTRRAKPHGGPCGAADL